MKKKTETTSLRIFLTFLVIFLILCSLVIGHRIFLIKFQPQTTLKGSQYDIDTNFIKFKVTSHPLKNRSAKLLIESKSIDNETVLLFISDRESGEVDSFVWKDSYDGSTKLVRNSLLKLAELGKFNSYVYSDFYIFDLMIEDSVLYLSIVEIPQNKSDCDLFKVLSINIADFTLKLESIKQVWQSSTCTKSFPNNPGWNDFHGRLASSKNHIYLTAGLLIASTYQGTYPNPNIYNVDSNLFKEIQRDKLFGSIIQIDRNTGQSREFASGFRGPSGITIQNDTGRELIWALDHGPRGGDELNLVEFGRNYGWPFVSLGSKYFEPTPQNSKSQVIPTKFGNHDGYTFPKYVWTPSVAPSVVTSLNVSLDLINTWTKGDLLIGTLKGNSLIHVKLKQDRVILAEQVYLGVRIRDISVNNKVIFISTDDGRILTLNPSSITKPSGPFPDIYQKANFIYLKIPGIMPVISWLDEKLRKLAALL
jgi:hypothetical protein